MLTWENDVEATSLRKRGWTISAIARHLGHDRRTVRDYLEGKRIPGERVSSRVDPFEEFAEYIKIRLTDDPHVWATALFDEVVALGYSGSYPSFTRGLRGRALRPHCEPCQASTGRDHAIIDHPPGAETQFDWLELPDPPASWGWGSTAHLFVGALSHSSKWRAVLAESEDGPHMVEALDKVVRRLGGCTKVWRFDRMATVCHPPTGRITATFGPVAKFYGVGVDICPSRHGNRKGVVEKGNHSLAQRWWRTLADDLSPAQAQSSLDEFCLRVGDTRPRTLDHGRTTVGELAAGEPLTAPPGLAYPVTLIVERIVSAQALVAFRGNFYSIGPGMSGATVMVRHRLDATTIEVTTTSGVVLAKHRREPDGAGVIARADQHVVALEHAVLAAFSDRAPCRSKQRRPPSPAALAEAGRLRGAVSPAGEHVVVDLADYAAAAQASATAARAEHHKVVATDE
ncbi:MAG: transposase [Sporichthyaceae bacterium]|nr:transposase [Sporichthyaceae bacterium]